MRMEPVATDMVDTKQLLNVINALKKGDFSIRMPLSSRT